VAAVALADRDGLAGLTMRSLGAELGVEAMALYKHVANKDEILAGMVELVLGQIDVPDEGTPWRDAMWARAHSSLSVFRAHPWAIGLLQSQPPTVAVLQHHDRVFGILRAGGFTPLGTSIAFAVLASYVYGYVVQEASFQFTTSDELHEATSQVLETFDPAAYPHLAELATEVILQPGYTYADDFDLGLKVVLDGLQTLLEQSAAPGPAAPR
jgi:AcrR family transcriptional regulator